MGNYSCLYRLGMMHWAFIECMEGQPDRMSEAITEKCLCMYVCMYVCIYVRMYVCMYVRRYVCMHVCLPVCVLLVDTYNYTYWLIGFAHSCVRSCTYRHTFFTRITVYIYICVHAHIYSFLFFMYRCMCVCVEMHVPVYSCLYDQMKNSDTVKCT